MDENLRRLGVGDMSVGKNVKRMAEALYGRMNAYDEGVLAGDRELITVIQRNLYGTVENPNGAWLAAMAGYIRRQMKSTSSVSSTELKEGNAGYLPAGGEGG
jgi:cytochrome b pre-mRNA-processing protein 3